ncbi:hypothetical protein [Brevibacterium album]|uniref:hypothetical protein n=1 Tax=Brevibacterium album TaxID=417948 RepID=UPI0004225DFC|nr:hypothetical protein [Brevibacterium album]
MGLQKVLVLLAVLLLVVGGVLRRIGRARANRRVTRLGTMALLALPVCIIGWFVLLASQEPG